MHFQAVGKHRQLRSTVAIVAALCVLAALTGCWALRSQLAAADAAQTVAATESVSDIVQLRCDDANNTSQFCPGFLSTSQKPVKSAGIKRDRPPTWSRSAPPQWVPTPASMTSFAYPRGAARSHALVIPHDGQDILTQLCVARR